MAKFINKFLASKLQQGINATLCASYVAYRLAPQGLNGLDYLEVVKYYLEPHEVSEVEQGIVDEYTAMLLGGEKNNG